MQWSQVHALDCKPSCVRTRVLETRSAHNAVPQSRENTKWPKRRLQVAFSAPRIQISDYNPINTHCVMFTSLNSTSSTTKTLHITIALYNSTRKKFCIGTSVSVSRNVAMSFTLRK